MGNGQQAGWWRVAAGACAAALVLGASGCGDDDGGGAPQSGERETTTTVDDAATEPVAVLVTNDDGVGAEGIDTLVDALTAIEGVEVTVVAPADEQSGQGGNETDGPLHSNEATTAGGYEAVAVDGFPADTVRVAIDEMGLEPDLVVSGINEGQNLGPIVDVSGTVGAARAAARRGVPALAVSQGLGDEPDFDAGAELAVGWVTENLDALRAGEVGSATVFSLNVPTCDNGEHRGQVEVAVATSGDDVLSPSDCASTDEGQTDDVSAFVAGFATLSELPVEPAA
jgi:5'-nucleotidase